jgi:hypothetical protein
VRSSLGQQWRASQVRNPRGSAKWLDPVQRLMAARAVPVIPEELVLRL